MSARRQPNGRGSRDDDNSNRINEQIRAREVRVVGDNVEQGIYTIQEARRMAQQQELDLVEISPNADPPVCKILDYQKFLYQQKKRLRSRRPTRSRRRSRRSASDLRRTTMTTASNSAMPSASCRRAVRCVLMSFSEDGPLSSRIKGSCSSFALPTISMSMLEWISCQS